MTSIDKASQPGPTNVGCESSNGLWKWGRFLVVGVRQVSKTLVFGFVTFDSPGSRRSKVLLQGLRTTDDDIPVAHLRISLGSQQSERCQVWQSRHMHQLVEGNPALESHPPLWMACSAVPPLDPSSSLFWLTISARLGTVWRLAVPPTRLASLLSMSLG